MDGISLKLSVYCVCILAAMVLQVSSDGLLHLEPVTPPLYSKRHDTCYRYTVLDHEIYCVRWKGDWVAMHIPHEAIVSIEKIEQSPEYAAIMADTTLVTYGAECQIRSSTSPDGLSVYKMALPDDTAARKRLVNEHQILQALESHKLTVQTDTQCLLDRDGVFAYRMERLETMPRHEILQRYAEIRVLLARLHTAGYVHGDFHPSNIMKTPNQELRLIDFGQGGQIGDKLPPENLWRTWKGETLFSPKIDRIQLDEIYQRLLKEAERGEFSYTGIACPPPTATTLSAQEGSLKLISSS